MGPDDVFEVRITQVLPDGIKGAQHGRTQRRLQSCGSASGALPCLEFNR
jgi:hypothetical protein